eukprot:2214777-Prymnesium_polylepis.1
MLGGCVLDPLCLCQHLAAPDAHTSEVHAASTRCSTAARLTAGCCKRCSSRSRIRRRSISTR